jgi:hypothetical protein
VRFEVLTAVKMPMFVFWVVTPCRHAKVSEERTAVIFRAEDGGSTYVLGRNKIKLSGFLIPFACMI